MIKKLVKSNEFIPLVIIIVLSLVVGLINPNFLTIATLFDLVRASNVYIILALALLPVVILGGVDISFVAIAAVASYSTHMFLLARGYQGGMLTYVIMACAIGAFAGLFNAFFVNKFKLPIFDVSLATQTMWYGFTLFFVGATSNFDIPEGLVGYYARYLTRVSDPITGETGLHISILYVIVIAIFLWWFLKYTMIGRGIYAIGGNKEVAERTGFNINRIHLVVFLIMGVLSGFAGVLQGSFSRNFNPTLFIGQNLDVLAAIILGGAAIKGGRGTVIGTILGVVLTQIINRALVLTQIPAEWQKFVVGLILIIFTSIPAIKENRKKQVGRTTELVEVTVAE
ncbi:MAG: ABC transporter permease [Chloroflexi bacterium]|jgi:simple sugar transport system permease protein|nr:ABC transporter permease [Chloroflexota bacterium]